jgi:hypothetical protein
MGILNWYFLANQIAIISEQNKCKAKIEHGLPNMVPGLVYEFQMICLRGLG